MSCKGFVQVLLEVLNFLFLISGLAIVGYGIYMVATYKSASSLWTSSSPSDVSYLNQELYLLLSSLSPFDLDEFEYTLDDSHLVYKVSSPLPTIPLLPLVRHLSLTFTVNVLACFCMHVMIFGLSF